MSAVVYLVLSHEERSLRYLCKALGDDQSILVHYDLRRRQPEGDGIEFVKNRFPVYWGGFGMINATISLLREATSRYPDAKRYFLISGDSLPVVRASQIEATIANSEEEYISLREVAWKPELRNVPIKNVTAEDHNSWRFQNFSFLDNAFNPIHRPDTAKSWSLADQQVHQVFGAADRTFADLALKLPPRERLFEFLFFGSQWWAISRDAAKHILQEYTMNQEIRLYFSNFFAPDEHLFHCIIGNSEFRSRCRHTLMHPRLDSIQMEDIIRIRSQRKSLFVRKFNPMTSQEIAAAIDHDQYFDTAQP